MTPYEATHAAADHIEQNPELFNFHRIRVPDCGAPGCALGWIGAFAGIAPGESIARTEEFLQTSDKSFYRRMNGLVSEKLWQRNPRICAKGLRLYAEKYLASDKSPEQDFIPASVRRIFEVEVA